MNPSLLSYCGHIEQKVQATISEDRQKLITLGVDDLVNMWNINDMTSRQSIELSNPNGQNFTCIQYNQRQKAFVLGSESGTVYMLGENDTSNFRIIYKSQRPIAGLRYSRSYNYLAIATNQPCAVLYSQPQSRFYRCNTAHENETTFAMLTNDQQCMVTIGTDGFANVYRVQLEATIPIEQVHRYRMCHKAQIKALTMCCEHPTQPGHLIFSGSTMLQQVSVTSSPSIECSYQIKADIYEDTEIIALCWLNANIIGLATDNKLSLWNYITKTRIHVINDLTLRPIFSDLNGKLLAISSKSVERQNSNGVGLVYKYQNKLFISKQNQEADIYKQRLKNQANGIMPQWEQPEEIQQKQNKTVEPKKIKKIQPEYASKLIVDFPQTSLQSLYNEHNNSQFLFYNQHGCVVGRTDGQKKSYQLEYHDKFKLRRIKFESDDKYICYFMLSENCFMYSSQTHVYFEMEYSRRNRREDGSIYKQPSIIKWDYKLSKIQGFGIGNCWVAIVCMNQIYIFDYMGNQMHCISYDRQFLAMAVYQDILAVAYDAQIPLTQSQLFQVKLYKIQSRSWKLEKKIRMPVKNGEKLKWFGFSEQGCLYNHDTSETVRMYCWDSDQWVSVFSIDNTLFNIFIQHIENNQIYGFKIEQEIGEPSMPTVMPRSLPRKIALQMPDRKLSYFSEDENKRLLQIITRRLSLLHERFRTRRWYKYKYARRQYHPMFKHSQKIMSQEDIEELMTRHDIEIVELLKKIIPGLQSRSSGNEPQVIKYELSGLCSSLVFFQQSITKIAQILQSSHYLNQLTDPCTPPPRIQPKKYKQLSRLQAMVDIGWIDRSDQ